VLPVDSVHTTRDADSPVVPLDQPLLTVETSEDSAELKEDTDTLMPDVDVSTESSDHNVPDNNNKEVDGDDLTSHDLERRRRGKQKTSSTGEQYANRKIKSRNTSSHVICRSDHVMPRTTATEKEEGQYHTPRVMMNRKLMGNGECFLKKSLYSDIV